MCKRTLGACYICSVHYLLRHTCVIVAWPSYCLLLHIVLVALCCDSASYMALQELSRAGFHASYVCKEAPNLRCPPQWECQCAMGGVPAAAGGYSLTGRGASWPPPQARWLGSGLHMRSIARVCARMHAYAAWVNTPRAHAVMKRARPHPGPGWVLGLRMRTRTRKHTQAVGAAHQQITTPRTAAT